jgi:hypothetical protein
MKSRLISNIVNSIAIWLFMLQTLYLLFVSIEKEKKGHIKEIKKYLEYPM